jgi:hypothetical protein
MLQTSDDFVPPTIPAYRVPTSFALALKRKITPRFSAGKCRHPPLFGGFSRR